MEPKFEPKEFIWLRSKLPLDLMDIDEEVMKMPVILQKVSDFTSQAVEAKETAKDILGQVFSQVAARLRKEKTESGKPKSDAQIEKEIESDPEFVRQQDILSQARLDASLWLGLMEALRSKSSSLHSAVELIKVGWITQDYITKKRQAEVRGVPPRQVRP